MKPNASRPFRVWSMDMTSRSYSTLSQAQAEAARRADIGYDSEIRNMYSGDKLQRVQSNRSRKTSGERFDTAMGKLSKLHFVARMDQLLEIINVMWLELEHDQELRVLFAIEHIAEMGEA